MCENYFIFNLRRISFGKRLELPLLLLILPFLLILVRYWSVGQPLFTRQLLNSIMQKKALTRVERVVTEGVAKGRFVVIMLDLFLFQN